MRWTRSVKIPLLPLIVFLLLMSGAVFQNCDTVPPDVYDNPLDTLATPPDGEDPIETPALVFFPDEATVTVGYSVTVEVFALAVEDLAGAYIKISYDQDKLNLLSVAEGDFFESGLGTIFLYDDDNTNGILEINTSYLGDDTVSVIGTGSIADLVFSSKSPGLTTLTYSTECSFVDPDNIPITILGYGEGVINAE